MDSKVKRILELIEGQITFERVEAQNRSRKLDPTEDDNIACGEHVYARRVLEELKHTVNAKFDDGTGGEQSDSPTA